MAQAWEHRELAMAEEARRRRSATAGRSFVGSTVSASSALAPYLGALAPYLQFCSIAGVWLRNIEMETNTTQWPLWLRTDVYGMWMVVVSMEDDNKM